MTVDLRADCASCAALCCVAFTLTRSADFAIDKPAGTPCPNLEPDHRCGIHAQLRERGFPGCAVYDCFGAGQRVTQVTYGGRGWTGQSDLGARMFDVFGVMRQLHEILWYLDEVVALAPDRRGEVTALVGETERLTAGTPEELMRLDVPGLRARVNDVLLRTSHQLRSGVRTRPPDLRGSDLMGARLHRAALRAADLRGAYLIGADLRDADLSRADLIGADLRDADLRGARLELAMFLTQMQVNAARGDARTTLPDRLERPAQWT